MYFSDDWETQKKNNAGAAKSRGTRIKTNSCLLFPCCDLTDEVNLFL